VRGNLQKLQTLVQLEFFPWSIRDFTATIGSIAPFVSLGGQYSFYRPKATSLLGPGLGELYRFQ
jgi:hypothetical protein